MSLFTVHLALLGTFNPDSITSMSCFSLSTFLDYYTVIHCDYSNKLLPLSSTHYIQNMEHKLMLNY